MQHLLPAQIATLLTALQVLQAGVRAKGQSAFDALPPFETYNMLAADEMTALCQQLADMDAQFGGGTTLAVQPTDEMAGALAALWSGRSGCADSPSTTSQPSAIEQFIENEGVWASYPDHPREDWKYEVANGDTNAGYWEWVRNEAERADHSSEE